MGTEARSSSGTSSVSVWLEGRYTDSVVVRTPLIAQTCCQAPVSAVTLGPTENVLVVTSPQLRCSMEPRMLKFSTAGSPIGMV